MASSHHVFGIRHHGPGCARALEAALEALAPDLVLVEGPPDANEALALAGDPRMEPPLALLVYALDEPQRAAFYPFAAFSPEWRALRFASQKRVPARFMDLPCAYGLAAREDDAEPTGSGEPTAEPDPLRDDPIGVLSEAAGYRDREQWWDRQVELRVDATGLFEGILEAMAAVRADVAETRPRELLREAHMRTTIRAAHKEGFTRIAVVCGAYHAPALVDLSVAKEDAALLRGLPKIKVAATWIPWTSSRLSYRSGYGAGVDSPGWYDHVFRYGARAPLVWATLAARLLREEDLDASSASVIETVRLADALASLRELPSPGLCELREAIESVLVSGDGTRLALVRAKLEIGEALGSVADDAGKVPLMRHFEQELKRLRLKLTAEITTLELDLRKDLDLARSRLLHRLRVLDVPWGTLAAGGAGTGTFRERWTLTWTPSLNVELIAKNLLGHTIEHAASRVLIERAPEAVLPELTAMVEITMIAALPSALGPLLDALDARAASSSDVRLQLEALGPLARVARYGDVRETRAEHVLPVLYVLLERAVVGLPAACVQLDDAAAAALVSAISEANAACLLLDDEARRRDWLAALTIVSEREHVHPRIAGRACRLLLAQHVLGEDALSRRASHALSPSVEPATAARWLEGLLEGEGALLAEQPALLALLDAFLVGLATDAFQAQLPLLRRALSGMSAGGRRMVAQQLARTGPGRRAQPERASALDAARAARLLPVFARVLGVDHG